MKFYFLKYKFTNKFSSRLLELYNLVNYFKHNYLSIRKYL